MPDSKYDYGSGKASSFLKRNDLQPGVITNPAKSNQESIANFKTPSNSLPSNETQSAVNSDNKAKGGILKRIETNAGYHREYQDNACFRSAINKRYLEMLKAEVSTDPDGNVIDKEVFKKAETGVFKKIQQNAINRQTDRLNTQIKNFDTAAQHEAGAQVVWKNDKNYCISAASACADKATAAAKAAKSAKQEGVSSEEQTYSQTVSGPFDRRLDRLFIQYDKSDIKRPFANLSGTPDVATAGYLISEEAISRSYSGTNNTTGGQSKEQMLARREESYNKMKNNEFYVGLPALQNTYAIVKLYGSKGGQLLVNQKGQRRWYEVDGDYITNAKYNYSSTPTTSTLISWGNADPNGRTPYHFTDFVFSKHWNKIQNNRLITLRRYAAPILDNLKFPGMDVDGAVAFPPMASAITYFGDGTENDINSLLKFTTGVLWEDVQAAIWEVNAASTPDSKTGAGKLYGGLTKLAEMLNIGTGNFDRATLQNEGHLPPDPYSQGPYENRIQGPVNRIDAVKKRKPGLEFKWDGLNIVFEYVARPVGGVNSKAVLLDIMSNFLIIGSASAVFFGGAHRFMADPAIYPFIGGDRGIEKMYRGKPIDWATSAIEDLAGRSQTVGAGIWQNVQKFWSALMSGSNLFGAVNEGLFTGTTGNFIQKAIASKTAGQVPFLQGMRAILTGEPVGEWHVTIGNPLNPIAMIGNLVCKNIEVEFGKELGPDDFPTEIKITVKLDHAMARDRDSIESIFNRGMGRIYDLPDGFKGSADFQTAVDNYTKQRVETGNMAGAGTIDKGGWAELAKTNTIGRGAVNGVNGKPLSMGGNVSVWNKNKFSVFASPNMTVENDTDYALTRSAYRSANWVGFKALT